MNRPRMNNKIARGLFMIDQLYEVIFDNVLGDAYSSFLDSSNKIDSTVPGRPTLLDVEDARTYIEELREYYRIKNNH